MNTLGELIVFGAAFVLIATSVCVAGRKQRTIFINKPRFYKFFLGGGILSIIYFLAVRGVPNLMTLINYGKSNTVNEYVYSVGGSKVLLLDMCPFLSVFMPILHAFRPKSKLNKLLASISIFTGSITLYAIKYSTINNFDFQYLFFGIAPNQLYFLMHFNIVAYGIAMLLVRYEPFSKIDFIHVMYAGAIYLLYAYILKLIFRVEYNVTGLVVNDGIFNEKSGVIGEYHLTGQIINLNFPNVYGVVIAAFLLFCGFIMGVHNVRYQLLIHYYYFGAKKKIVMVSSSSHTSVISHLIDHPRKNELHGEGRLDFVTFGKAYGTVAWTESSGGMRIYFLSCGIFVFYFPAIVIQYVLKKGYCHFVDGYQAQKAKKNPKQPNSPDGLSQVHE